MERAGAWGSGRSGSQCGEGGLSSQPLLRTHRWSSAYVWWEARKFPLDVPPLCVKWEAGSCCLKGREVKGKGLTWEGAAGQGLWGIPSTLSFQVGIVVLVQKE